MTTPEGKVKKEVKLILDHYGCYWFQPVQTGFGAAGLDFHCVYMFQGFPLAFFIETKAPGKTVDRNSRQGVLVDKLRGMGVSVFVIDGLKTLAGLETWLRSMQVQSTPSLTTMTSP